MSLVQPKAIESQNPFYITNNSLYGTAWQSAGNKMHDALNNNDVPQYKTVVSTPLPKRADFHTGRQRSGFEKFAAHLQAPSPARDA